MAVWLFLLCAWGAPSLAREPSTLPQALTSCLAEADVPFLARHGSDWARVTSPYNLRLNYTPAAVAVPESTAQMQAAVVCGVENGVRVTAKSGGHSFGAFGLGGEDGHLVLELDGMRSVTLGADKTARIQPGARLLHVATELYRQGRRAIPHGSCLGVGISGLVLHGGFGLASRTHGLTLDWLVGATAILANGSVAHCSATENQDLFWALRGAGSSFAIVAEFEFETFKAPSQVTPFTIDLPWDRIRAFEAIKALQTFAASAPRELNLMLDLTPTSKSVMGAYYGDRDGADKALRPLLGEIGGTLSTTSTMGWIQGLLFFDRVDPVDPYDSHDTFYATSFMTHALADEQVQALVSALFAQENRSPARDSLYLSVEAHGGDNSAVADAGRSATAYVHRDKLLLFQLFHGGSHGHYHQDGFELLKSIRESVTGLLGDGEWGMYANYLDTRLDATTAGSWYWGDNLARLRDIKAKLDPSQVFWNPQGVMAAKYVDGSADGEL